ncbi:hypothetical protein Tcan_05637 [Toxocara canis]|uniref:Globin domain-containing protein n=1 Tax=Toxocara canis TaxID=6265 RepID=A0A0B2VRL4_TOXCA|nr:hypothetical protein Tcan_05637 [Toxocara canis]
MYRLLVRSNSAIEGFERIDPHRTKLFDVSANDDCPKKSISIRHKNAQLGKMVQSFDSTRSANPPSAILDRPPRKGSKTRKGELRTPVRAEVQNETDSAIPKSTPEPVTKNKLPGENTASILGFRAIQKKLPLMDLHESSVESLDDDLLVAKVIEQTNRLSAQHRATVQATFMEMEKDAVRNGLQILLSMFSDHPQYKGIWPQFRNVPDSALISTPELTKHSRVYMTHMVKPVIEMAQEKAGSQFEAPQVAGAWTTLYDVIANLIDIYRKLEKRDSFHK